MNQTSNYPLTIIMPVFNEADNIDRIYREISSYFLHCPVSACLLFVDDGSTDSSLHKIQLVCEQSEAFYYISLRKNSGISAALKAGIDQTMSPYVGYMDADLQTDIRDFDILLQHITEYKLVTGIRVARKDSIFKRVQSFIANRFRRFITHDGATDTGCPLKLMHTDYAKRIPLFTGMHRFLPALILLDEGGSYLEVPVRHYPRTAGISKFTLRNRLLNSLVDCFAYKWIAARYIKYTVCKTNL